MVEWADYFLVPKKQGPRDPFLALSSTFPCPLPRAPSWGNVLFPWTGRQSKPEEGYKRWGLRPSLLLVLSQPGPPTHLTPTPRLSRKERFLSPPQQLRGGGGTAQVSPGGAWLHIPPGPQHLLGKGLIPWEGKKRREGVGLHVKEQNLGREGGSPTD